MAEYDGPDREDEEEDGSEDEAPLAPLPSTNSPQPAYSADDWDSFTIAGQPKPTSAKPAAPRSRNEQIGRDAFEREGLDPDLAPAMMAQESGGNQYAISPKNARGIFQMLPGTFARFGGDPKNIFDPEQNASAAAKYVKYLSDRYNGNLDLMLAGYNAGEGAVEKHGGVPPYKETQAYIYGRDNNGKHLPGIKERYALIKQQGSAQPQQASEPQQQGYTADDWDSFTIAGSQPQQTQQAQSNEPVNYNDQLSQRQRLDNVAFQMRDPTTGKPLAPSQPEIDQYIQTFGKHPALDPDGQNNLTNFLHAKRTGENNFQAYKSPLEQGAQTAAQFASDYEPTIQAYKAIARTVGANQVARQLEEQSTPQALSEAGAHLANTATGGNLYPVVNRLLGTDLTEQNTAVDTNQEGNPVADVANLHNLYSVLGTLANLEAIGSGLSSVGIMKDAASVEGLVGPELEQVVKSNAIQHVKNLAALFGAQGLLENPDPEGKMNSEEAFLERLKNGAESAISGAASGYLAGTNPSLLREISAFTAPGALKTGLRDYAAGKPVDEIGSDIARSALSNALYAAINRTQQAHSLGELVAGHPAPGQPGEAPPVEAPAISPDQIRARMGEINQRISNLFSQQSRTPAETEELNNLSAEKSKLQQEINRQRVAAQQPQGQGQSQQPPATATPAGTAIYGADGKGGDLADLSDGALQAEIARTQQQIASTPSYKIDAIELKKRLSDLRAEQEARAPQQPGNASTPETGKEASRPADMKPGDESLTKEQIDQKIADLEKQAKDDNQRGILTNDDAELKALSDRIISHMDEIDRYKALRESAPSEAARAPEPQAKPVTPAEPAKPVDIDPNFDDEGHARPFGDTERVHLADKGRYFGLNEQQISQVGELHRQGATDPITGYGINEHISPTIENIQRSGKDGAYALIQTTNLAGLNNAYADPLSANEVIGKFSDILREELEPYTGPDAKLHFFRADGPNFAVTASGLDPEVLRSAISRAQARVHNEVVKPLGLDRIPSPKIAGAQNEAEREEGYSKSGSGIQFAVEPIDRRSSSKIRESAQQTMEESYKDRAVDRSILDEKYKPQVPDRGRQPEYLTREIPKNERGAPFESPQELTRRQFDEIASNLSKAQRDKLYKAIDELLKTEDFTRTDSLLGKHGFLTASDREYTARRAVEYLDNNLTNAHYVEFDFRNVGGLNNLGRQRADAVLEKFGELINKHISESGLNGKVILFRHGGDEVSAIVVGPDSKKIQAQLDKAKVSIDNYVKREKLDKIPHPKNSLPGTGIVSDVAKFEPKTPYSTATLQQRVEGALTDAGRGVEEQKTALKAQYKAELEKAKGAKDEQLQSGVPTGNSLDDGRGETSVVPQGPSGTLGESSEGGSDTSARPSTTEGVTPNASDSGSPPAQATTAEGAGATTEGSSPEVSPVGQQVSNAATASVSSTDNAGDSTAAATDKESEVAPVEPGSTEPKKPGDMSRNELTAEKTRLQNEINDKYWAFTRQAKGQPPPKELYDRLTEVRTLLGEKLFPWQRTQAEMTTPAGGDMPAEIHAKQVEKALSEGKDVPADVLKDYPDLAAKYGKQSEAPTVAATPEATPEAAKVAEPEKPTGPRATATIEKAGKDRRAVIELPDGSKINGTWRENKRFDRKGGFTDQEYIERAIREKAAAIKRDVPQPRSAQDQEANTKNIDAKTYQLIDATAHLLRPQGSPDIATTDKQGYEYSIRPSIERPLEGDPTLAYRAEFRRAGSGNDFASAMFGRQETYQDAATRLGERLADRHDVNDASDIKDPLVRKAYEGKIQQRQDEATAKANDEQALSDMRARQDSLKQKGLEYHKQQAEQAKNFKGKKQTITVKDRTGNPIKDMPAEVFGDLAIHQSASEKAKTTDLVVEHLPTNRTIGSFQGQGSISRARALVKAVQGNDWSFTDPNNIPEAIQKNAYPYMRAAGNNSIPEDAMGLEEKIAHSTGKAELTGKKKDTLSTPFGNKLLENADAKQLYANYNKLSDERSARYERARNYRDNYSKEYSAKQDQAIDLARARFEQAVEPEIRKYLTAMSPDEPRAGNSQQQSEAPRVLNQTEIKPDDPVGPDGLSRRKLWMHLINHPLVDADGKKMSYADGIKTVDKVMYTMDSFAKSFGYDNVDDWYKRTFANVISDTKPRNDGKKGSVEFINKAQGFLKNGQAVLSLFENADASTLIHEFGHIYRQQFSDNENRVLENWINTQSGLPKIENGDWTVPHEEYFARGMENYFRNGQLPQQAPGKLKQIFDSIGGTLKNIYDRLQANGPIKIPFSRSVKQFFDDVNFNQEATDAVNQRFTRGAEALERGNPADTPNDSTGTLQPQVYNSVDKGMGEGKIPTANPSLRGQGELATRSVPESARPYLDPELAKQVPEQQYNRLTNDQTADAAQKLIARDGAQALQMATGDRSGPLENEVAVQLMNKAQQDGDFTKARTILNALAKRSTEAGQAIQILSRISRVSPEGAMNYADSIIDREAQNIPAATRQKASDISSKLNAMLDAMSATQPVKEALIKFFQKNPLPNNFKDQIIKAGQNLQGSARAQEINDLVKKAYKIPTFDNESAKKVYDLAVKAQGLPDGREKDIALGQMQKVIAEKIPASPFAKAGEAITYGKLLNPATIMKYLVGHAGFPALEYPKDLVKAGVDKVTGLFTGKRTTDLPEFGSQISNAKQAIARRNEDISLGIDTSKDSLPRISPFKSEAGKQLSKLFNYVYSAVPTGIKEASYTESLRSQMKAAKVTTPTDAMKEIAEQESKEKALSDDSYLAGVAQTVRKILNGGKESGLGDAVLKFARVPANLVSRGVEYSGGGFVRAAYELARPTLMEHGIVKPSSKLDTGEFRQRRFADATSRGLVGSIGLVGLGALLTAKGVIVPNPEDKDAARIRAEAGAGGDRINLSGLARYVAGGDPSLQKGDTTAKFDTLMPFGFMLHTGMSAYQASKGEGSLGSYVKGWVNGIDSTLINDGLVKNVSEAFEPKEEGGTKSYLDKGLSLAARLPGLFIPTILEQTRNLVDDRARGGKEITGNEHLDEAINDVMRNLPGLSEMLPDERTTFGGVKTVRAQGAAAVPDVYANPLKASTYNPSQEEANSLGFFSQIGHQQGKQYLPKMLRNDVAVNGVPKQKLTPEQANQRQEVYGEFAGNLINDAADSKAFDTLPAPQKATELSKQLEFAHHKTESQLFNSKPAEQRKFAKTPVSLPADQQDHNYAVMAERDKSLDDLDKRETWKPLWDQLNAEQQKHAKDQISALYNKTLIEPEPFANDAVRKARAEQNKLLYNAIKPGIEIPVLLRSAKYWKPEYEQRR